MSPSSYAAPGRGVAGWDAQHAASKPEPGPPHPAVVEAASARPPGRALDIACGTGRHSLWLAQQGWRVTGLDFSIEGLTKASAAADKSGRIVDWVLADARAWDPPGDPYDLVLLSFVQLPEVLERATAWIAPGGLLVTVGHAVRNLDRGRRRPQRPAAPARPRAPGRPGHRRPSARAPGRRGRARHPRGHRLRRRRGGGAPGHPPLGRPTGGPTAVTVVVARGRRTEA